MLISVAFILPVTVKSPVNVSVVFRKYVACTESLPDCIRVAKDEDSAV